MYARNYVKRSKEVYHEKLLVTIDGSDILLPTTKELKEEYGYTKVIYIIIYWKQEAHSI